MTIFGIPSATQPQIYNRCWNEELIHLKNKQHDNIIIITSLVTLYLFELGMKINKLLWAKPIARETTI